MFVLIYPLCFNSNYPRAFLESVLHLNASGIYFLSGFNQIGSNISVNYSLPKFFYGWKAQIFSLSFHTMASFSLYTMLPSGSNRHSLTISPPMTR